MAINTSALNSTLQSRVDALDAATETKEVLLLSKALEAAAGSTSVSDVLSEGVVQVNNVNSEGSAQVANVQNEGATQRASVGAVLGDYTLTTGFKTVGGASIVGSGDIATLPSGGTAGQIIKKDASNNPAWGSVAPAGLLQTTATSYNGWDFFDTNNLILESGLNSGVISLVGGTSSKFIVTVHLEGEWNHETMWFLYRSIDGGPNERCPFMEGAGNPNYGVGHFSFDYDPDNNSTISNTNASYIDEPSASSSIKYTVYVRNLQGGYTYLNRTIGGEIHSSGVSRMTVMEVSV